MRSIARSTLRSLPPRFGFCADHRSAVALKAVEFATTRWPREPLPAGNGLLVRTARRDPRYVALLVIVQLPSRIVLCFHPLRWARHAFDLDGDEVLIPACCTSKCALVVPGICGLDAGQRHWTTAIRAGGMRDK